MAQGMRTSRCPPWEGPVWVGPSTCCISNSTSLSESLKSATLGSKPELRPAVVCAPTARSCQLHSCCHKNQVVVCWGRGWVSMQEKAGRGIVFHFGRGGGETRQGPLGFPGHAGELAHTVPVPFSAAEGKQRLWSSKTRSNLTLVHYLQTRWQIPDISDQLDSEPVRAFPNTTGSMCIYTPASEPDASQTSKPGKQLKPQQYCSLTGSTRNKKWRRRVHKQCITSKFLNLIPQPHSSTHFLSPMPPPPKQAD